MHKSSSKVLENGAGGRYALNEVESLVWSVAKIPTCDLHGHQFKAALYALLAGLELVKRPANAAEAFLAGLIRDLVRDTPYCWPLVIFPGSQATRRDRRWSSKSQIAFEPLAGGIDALRPPVGPSRLFAILREHCGGASLHNPPSMALSCAQLTFLSTEGWRLRAFRSFA